MRNDSIEAGSVLLPNFKRVVPRPNLPSERLGLRAEVVLWTREDAHFKLVPEGSAARKWNAFRVPYAKVCGNRGGSPMATGELNHLICAVAMPMVDRMVKACLWRPPGFALEQPPGTSTLASIEEADERVAWAAGAYKAAAIVQQCLRALANLVSCQEVIVSSDQ